MARSLEERIAELQAELESTQKMYKGALDFLTKKETENEALEAKVKELEGKLEIAKNAIKDAIYCKDYYSDPVTTMKVAVKDLENGLEQLNKREAHGKVIE